MIWIVDRMLRTRSGSKIRLDCAVSVPSLRPLGVLSVRPMVKGKAVSRYGGEGLLVLELLGSTSKLLFEDNGRS
ncbi:hypothetical protein YC2023_113434 [Brassica napus]